VDATSTFLDIVFTIMVDNKQTEKVKQHKYARLIIFTLYCLIILLFRLYCVLTRAALSRQNYVNPTAWSRNRIERWFKNNLRKKEAYQRPLAIRCEACGLRQYCVKADCRHTSSRKYVRRQRIEIRLLRVVGRVDSLSVNVRCEEAH